MIMKDFSNLAWFMLNVYRTVTQTVNQISDVNRPF